METLEIVQRVELEGRTNTMAGEVQSRQSVLSLLLRLFLLLLLLR